MAEHRLETDGYKSTQRRCCAHPFKVTGFNERGDLIRRVITYDVLRHRNGSRISIAAPGDFACLRRPAAGTLAQPAFPYCLDFLRARCLYVVGVEPQQVQSAPFYYLYLRRHACRVLSVPVELVPIAAAPQNDPVFLFSPGRCGSTFLSQVLFEAGFASVSEPDFCTQMASWFWSQRFNPLAPVFGEAMRAMSADLAAALGGVPVVKLRAECARAPELFVRSPVASTIALFRRFESWSRSTAQVFGAQPGKAVRKYMTALRCYDWLRRNSRCHLMWYEDWLNAPAAAAGALGGFLGRSINPEAVARANLVHSQAGTPLLGRIRPGWEAKWEGALRLWQSPRLVTARRRLDLPGIWD